jgi:metal-dependent hydrolase (beta-lactamase superfamily II)
LKWVEYWLLKIEILPASYGDSFLVTCIGKENTYILIDMGFMSSYSNSIKERLLEINNNGESLALLVFTHVDDDHISGGIKFFSENGPFENPNVIKIENIWFNSFRHLQFDKKNSCFPNKEIKSIKDKKNEMILEVITNNGRPKEQGHKTIDSIGVSKGSTLASLIYYYDYMDIWNTHFNNNAVMVEELHDNSSYCFRKINLNQDVKITILSPDTDKLLELDELWREKLFSEGFKGAISSDELMDDAFEVYFANVHGTESRSKKIYNVSSDLDITRITNESFEADSAPVNGSSIAFILEFEEKRVLFLADSHPDIIIEQLKKIAKKEKVEKLFFDAVKVSHHGSKHNTSNELLKLFIADKYIFSTSGRGKGFKHPDIETIFRIITVNTEREKKLIFNYKPLHIIQIIDKQNLKDKYNFSVEFTNDLSESIEGCIATVTL